MLSCLQHMVSIRSELCSVHPHAICMRIVPLHHEQPVTMYSSKAAAAPTLSAFACHHDVDKDILVLSSDLHGQQPEFAPNHGK